MSSFNKFESPGAGGGLLRGLKEKFNPKTWAIEPSNVIHAAKSGGNKSEKFQENSEYLLAMDEFFSEVSEKNFKHREEVLAELSNWYRFATDKGLELPIEWQHIALAGETELVSGKTIIGRITVGYLRSKSATKENDDSENRGPAIASE